MICRYSLLDVKTHLLVHQEIVHKKEEGCASNQMEAIGLERGLDYLENELNWPISSVTTDRNSTVSKILERRGITQCFDLWHIIKGVRNQWREVRL